MRFNGYDTDTDDILQGVLNSVWSALQTSGSELVGSVGAAQATRTKITRALLDAADNGERDPTRLKALALKELDRAERFTPILDETSFEAQPRGLPLIAQ